MAEEWVVVDFETASTRGTPCQLGAVKYRDGNEIDVLETMIFQPAQLFDPFNVMLHGITPGAVAHAPKWPDVREELLVFADGSPLMAHNAPFDMGVIRDASDMWSLDWPTLTYACMLTLARRVWPGQRSYSLLLLCSTLGIWADALQAHEALADARLAGAVLKHALADSASDSLDGLLEYACVVFGQMAPDGWYGCHSRAHALAANSIPINTDADPDSPFYGKHVAFTGELAMVRREAWQHVAARGGTPQDSVTKKTDLLVCGYQDAWKLAAGDTKSHKLQKAEALHAAGQSIEILTERDFFRMLHENGGTRARVGVTRSSARALPKWDRRLRRPAEFADAREDAV